ncbi:hypothetical protein [Salisediminibacterium selenitireducens]|uniref:Uncharacterized protein n=1 Tax=Bacillus selenitireducens (strain ATCC 700615 / DSM 15326 / MLS10) TaxID=439292 RepID=D6XZM8_BACIE|nr:hypothetical protein [Salisediminibacterium selenitireducens]ADH98402.1 hypothetical protein Bsel_0879 [[Bacillus] selenitireducens MLS10]
MREDNLVLLITDVEGNQYSPKSLVIEQISFQTRFSDMSKAIEECVKIKSIYKELNLSIHFE